MESDYVDGKGRRSVGLGTKTIAVFQGWNPVLPHTLSVPRGPTSLENRSFVEIDYREENKEGWIVVD